MFELFKMIQKELGFDYVFIPSSSGKFGSSDEQGGWNGLIGLLQRKKIDLSIVDLTITSTRDRV